MTEMHNLYLVMVSGDLIEVSYPSNISKEVIEEIRNASNGFWNGSDWIDLTIEFKGSNLTEINMANIIGIIH